MRLVAGIQEPNQLRLVLGHSRARAVKIVGGLLKLGFGLDHLRLVCIQSGLRHLDVVQARVEFILGNQPIAEQILPPLELLLGADKVRLGRLQVGLRGFQSCCRRLDGRLEPLHVCLGGVEGGILRINVGSRLDRLRLQEELAFPDCVAFLYENIGYLAEGVRIHVGEVGRGRFNLSRGRHDGRQILPRDLDGLNSDDTALAPDNPTCHKPHQSYRSHNHQDHLLLS